jgi:hypothetical protein
MGWNSAILAVRSACFDSWGSVGNDPQCSGNDIAGFDKARTQLTGLLST